MADDSASITFPNTFRSATTYLIGIGVFTAWGMFGTGLTLHQHQIQGATIVGAITGASIGLFLIVISTIIRVDDEGIHERCLFINKSIPWTDIGAVERLPKAYSLKTTSGRDLMLLTLLGTAQQQAVADEAKKRAGLALTREKVRHPVVERWTRV